MVVLASATQISLNGSIGLFDGHVNKLAGLISGFGILLAFTSVIAILGICCHSRSFLSAYICILVILIVAELSVGIAGFIFESRVVGLLVNTMRSAEASYNRNHLVKHSWDSVQRQLECCGVDNYTDWFHFFDNFSLPDSCCVRQNPSCGRHAISTGNFYRTVCSDAISKWAHFYKIPAAIVLPIIIVFQILSILWSKLDQYL